MPISASPPLNVLSASEWLDSPYAYGPYTVFGFGALMRTRMKYDPAGVGVAAVPTATGPSYTGWSPLKTWMRCELRLMSMR